MHTWKEIHFLIKFPILLWITIVYADLCGGTVYQSEVRETNTANKKVDTIELI